MAGTGAALLRRSTGRLLKVCFDYSLVLTSLVERENILTNSIMELYTVESL